MQIIYNLKDKYFFDITVKILLPLGTKICKFRLLLFFSKTKFWELAY